MKFYVFPASTRNSKKITFTAELLGIDYELVVLDPSKGEHKTREFLAINPMGQIPVLQDGSNFISESGAIVRYLCAINGDKLYGATPLEKATVDQWVDHFSHVIGPTVGTYYSEEIIKPKIHQKEADKSKLIEADKKLSVLLPIVEEQLTKNSFLAGDTISIADTVAHGYMSTVEKTSFSLEDYPKIKRWTEGLTATPEWQTMVKRYPRTF